MAKATVQKAPSTGPIVRLRVQYNQTITTELQKELGLANIHQVPKLEKVVVNIGLGKAKDDKKVLEVATNTLRKITGQQPVKTVAKNSIAGFKLREGNTLGLNVALRGARLYDVPERLVCLVLTCT